MPNPGKGGKTGKATAKPEVKAKTTGWKPTHTMNPMPNPKPPVDTKPIHTMNPLPNPKPVDTKPTHPLNPIRNPKN